jgi:hypothetical protein
VAPLRRGDSLCSPECLGELFRFLCALWGFICVLGCGVGEGTQRVGELFLKVQHVRRSYWLRACVRGELKTREGHGSLLTEEAMVKSVG